MRGLWRLADRAQHQSGARPVQESGHSGGRDQREVDEPVLREQRRTDDRDVAQTGDAVAGTRRQALALQRLAKEGGNSGAEQRQCQPRRVLVCQQPERERGEQQRERDARRRTGEEADLRDAARVSGAEARRRCDQHHALDAEVHDPTFLADNDAGRGQQQWRAGTQRGGDQRRDLVHAAAATRTRRTTRYVISVSQASRKNSSIPWYTPVSADGRPSRDCASSPPI